eukprot:772420_1
MISKTCTAPFIERVQLLNQTGATHDTIISIYSYKRCSIIRFYLITAAMNDFVVFQIGDSNMTSLKQRSEYKSKKQTIDEMMTFKDSDLDKHGNSISAGSSSN